MKSAGPSESISRLDDVAKGAFKMALDNIRELAGLAARSHAHALEIVGQRVTKSIGELAHMLGRR